MRKKVVEKKEIKKNRERNGRDQKEAHAEKIDPEWEREWKWEWEKDMAEMKNINNRQNDFGCA